MRPQLLGNWMLIRIHGEGDSGRVLELKIQGQKAL